MASGPSDENVENTKRHIRTLVNEITELSKSEAKGLTIFSLVDQKHLAQLFSIVSAALRDAPPTPPKGQKAEANTGDCQGGSSAWNYTGITLPCIEFPSSKERRSKEGKKVNPLYITVS
jgi:hypothetical protein